MLFQLPVTLRITTAAALESLESAAGAAALELGDDADDMQVLGLWLAHERSKVCVTAWRVHVVDDVDDTHAWMEVGRMHGWRLDACMGGG